MYFDIRISLVILQANIVMGLVGLDQVDLGEQGLKLRVYNDEFDIDDMGRPVERSYFVRHVRCAAGNRYGRGSAGLIALPT